MRAQTGPKIRIGYWPIAAGLPDHFELEHEEMYGEPFGVPDPMETVFVSWFAGKQCRK